MAIVTSPVHSYFVHWNYSRLKARDWSQQKNDPTSIEIDQTFMVSGVGIVISGTVTSGTVFCNQTLMLGPMHDGSFRPILVRSIHSKRVGVSVWGDEEARAVDHLCQNCPITLLFVCRSPHTLYFTRYLGRLCDRRQQLCVVCACQEEQRAVEARVDPSWNGSHRSIDRSPGLHRLLGRSHGFAPPQHHSSQISGSLIF